MLMHKGNLYMMTTLALCHLAVLNTWERTEGAGQEIIESFAKVIQCPEETYSNFL